MIIMCLTVHVYNIIDILYVYDCFTVHEYLEVLHVYSVYVYITSYTDIYWTTLILNLNGI